MQVHLVDGTYELFRAFYAVPARRSGASRSGLGAVRGLARSLLALLREPEVTHAAVAFDHEIESFRNALFEGYKTSAGVDPALLAQFVPAEEVCRALGLITWPMVEFEADDAMATAAARFAAEPGVERVVLCSPDKDLAQCVVGRRVVCFDRMRRMELDADGVGAKFGVRPDSIPDWLALVGDTADGIPGIPRWGRKSASAVLAAYGRLEAIPADAAQWTVKVRGAETLAANLREHREEAFLFRQLATLRTDVPLAESLCDLRWRGPRSDALEALAERVGDATLADDARQIASRAEQF